MWKKACNDAQHKCSEAEEHTATLAVQLQQLQSELQEGSATNECLQRQMEKLQDELQESGNAVARLECHIEILQGEVSTSLNLRLDTEGVLGAQVAQLSAPLDVRATHAATRYKAHCIIL